MSVEAPPPMTPAAKPARAAVAEWLREQIIRGALEAGTFLDEKWVSTNTAVSRTPVREAFQLLAAEKFLQLLPRKGAQVRPVTVVELGEMYEMRRLIEGEAVRAICARGTGAPAGMKDLLAVLEDCGARQDWYAEVQTDHAFHKALVEAAGNSLLSEAYANLGARQQRVAMRALTANPDRIGTIDAEHRALVEHLDAADEAGAMKTLSQHLRVVSEVAADLSR